MYRKKLAFLLLMTILITGCTRIDGNLDNVVNSTIINNDSYVNTVSTGYELYMPIGVQQVVDNEYNQKLKIKDRYVYLYVDIISYYYKNKLNYRASNNYNYYYKELNIDNKTGYIGINKIDDDLYFVESVYNYSKIEFYCSLDDLPIIMANTLIVQNSIKYNDSLIKLKLSDDSSEGREIKYELDSPKSSDTTFNDYLQEYVPEEDNEVVLPDDD